MDEKKPKKPRKKLVVGNSYGNISVLSEIPGRPIHYNCRCGSCGAEMITIAHKILQYAASGCPTCRKLEKDKQQETEYKKYIGRSYGALTVIGYVGKRCYSMQNGKEINAPFMRCRCEKCGEETEIFLCRLKCGGAKQCAKCSQKNLDTGRETVRNTCVSGTSVTAIDGRRKRNKNSTTGHNGVSQMPSGMYRAYINFRRKQYHLGAFADINDAIAARERAEKEIYGDFLKWYAETYPEKWEKIKKKEPTDEKQ